MKIVLINFDKFVQANDIQRVSNPIPLDRGYTPTPDGVLSTELCGSNVTARKETFTYIELNGKFLQPIVYSIFKRIDRRIDSIINGTVTYSIDNSGQIVEDENGGTGIEWLYDNWGKIKFQKNYSIIRSERIDLFTNYKKEELFTSKWLVIPAYYRDINLQQQDSKKPKLHELNEPYCRLIRLASMLNQGDFAFGLHFTRFQIQNTLLEIYMYLKSRIEKKHGLIRKSLLGKSVDYGARLVISSPKYTYNSPDDVPVDFEHSGIPLSYCCSLFTPFFAGWLERFFTRECELTGYKYPVYDEKTKSIAYVKLKNPSTYFNDEYIKELMTKFLYSYGNRFDPVTMPTEDGRLVAMRFRGRFTSDKDTPSQPLMQRNFTLTDLFYLAAEDICADKHVYITRYPLTDHLGIFPSKIHVLSTHDTCDITLDGKRYKFYPKVDPTMSKDKVSVAFVEVLRMLNVFLQAMGADYDGDQVTVKGVYSQEANAEAEEKLHAASNFLSVNGTNIRTTTNEAVQTLYMMSRW